MFYHEITIKKRKKGMNEKNKMREQFREKMIEIFIKSGAPPHVSMKRNVYCFSYEDEDHIINSRTRNAFSKKCLQSILDSDDDIDNYMEKKKKSISITPVEKKKRVTKVGKG